MFEVLGLIYKTPFFVAEKLFFWYCTRTLQYRTLSTGDRKCQTVKVRAGVHVGG
jgi:hypothetical protein